MAVFYQQIQHRGRMGDLSPNFLLISISRSQCVDIEIMKELTYIHFIQPPVILYDPLSENHNILRKLDRLGAEMMGEFLSP